LTVGHSRNLSKPSDPALQRSREMIRRYQFVRHRVAILALVVSDLFVGLGALGAAFGGAILTAEEGRLQAGFADLALAGAVPSLALWLMLRALLGLYPGYGLDAAQELRLQTYSSFVALLVVSFALVALGMSKVFFYLVPLGVFGLILVAPVVRGAAKWLLKRTGLWGKPVVVLGEHSVVTQLAKTMLEDRDQGFRPVALFFDPEGERGEEDVFENSPHLGDLEDAPVFADASGINTAVLAVRSLQKAWTGELADWASTRFERVIVVPSLAGLTTSAIAARDLSGVLGVEVKHNLLDPRTRRIKRVMDLIATICGGVVIAPFFALLALLIWLESGGPIFYRDQRIGRGGKLFSCIKFRTMVSGAEDALQKLLNENERVREEYLKYHKLRDDPRVTRVGRFLRKTSLDELPQVWNVLRGDMSLVGPRPYLPRESEAIGVRLPEIGRVYPGITGLWQVGGRNLSSFSERVQVDAYYVRNWSVWLDIIILSRTAISVLLQRGAS
jgi:Undecaprenyl-phosphate galactose phosphotransferase WbaP